MFVSTNHAFLKNDGLSVCCGKPDTSYLSPPCLLSNTQHIVCACARCQFPMFGFDPVFSCLCVLCHREDSQWPCQPSGGPVLQMQSVKKANQSEKTAWGSRNMMLWSLPVFTHDCLHAHHINATVRQYMDRTKTNSENKDSAGEREV